MTLTIPQICPAKSMWSPDHPHPLCGSSDCCQKVRVYHGCPERHLSPLCLHNNHEQPSWGNAFPLRPFSGLAVAVHFKSKCKQGLSPNLFQHEPHWSGMNWSTDRTEDLLTNALVAGMVTNANRDAPKSIWEPSQKKEGIGCFNKDIWVWRSGVHKLLVVESV